jgi:glycine cleavage system H protein
MAGTIGYTKDHEWVRVDGDTATIGITTHAAEQLGDVVFVELPEVGKAIGKGEVAAAVESVKAASDVYSPVTGEVVETNGALEESPQTVNESPEDGGWFMKLKIANAGEADGLMDEAAYRDFVANL